MKKLNIKSDNCLLSINDYEGVTIDGQSLGEIVKNALPEGLEQYRKYPVRLSLSIELLGNTGLEVKTEGYEIAEKTSQDESKEETTIE